MSKDSDIRLTDFATIFAHLWYRDFPMQRVPFGSVGRADWTTHIAVTVRSAADLMGLFTFFEQGNRTDAVLCSRAKVVAPVEWEWRAVHNGDEIVNEIRKLEKRCSEKWCGADFACFIGYGREDGKYSDDTKNVIETWRERWAHIAPPLLLVLIRYERLKRDRFLNMTLDIVHRGRIERLRQQPAYPWDVIDSKWSSESSKFIGDESEAVALLKLMKDANDRGSDDQ